MDSNSSTSHILKAREYADQWKQYAVDLAFLERYTEALRAVDRALAINGAYVEAHLLRVHLLDRSESKSEAFQEFVKLSRSHGSEPAVNLSMAVFLMRNGWQREGAQMMQHCAALWENRAYVQFLAAASLLEVGESKRGAEYRKRGEECLEKLPKPWSSEGYDEKFDYTGFYGQWAIPDVLASCHPQGVRARANATETAMRVHSRTPGHPLLMSRIGRALMVEDEMDQARAWFRSALQVDPSFAEAHVELGFLEWMCEDGDVAEEHLRGAVERRPWYPDYHYQFGEFLASRGNMEEAIAQLRKALMLAPDYGVAALSLGDILAQSGETQKALRVLGSKALESWPESWLLQAKCHLHAGDSSKAKELVERVLATDAENPDALEISHQLKLSSSS